jgi:hypothetical protein
MFIIPYLFVSNFGTSICLLHGTFFFTNSTQLTSTNPRLQLAWDPFLLVESPYFPGRCTFVWTTLILLYSVGSVFAGSSNYLADMLFGILGGAKVPKTPESRHRTNLRLTVRKCNVTSSGSSEKPSEIFGHIPRVMKMSKYIFSNHIYFRLYFTYTFTNPHFQFYSAFRKSLCT